MKKLISLFLVAFIFSLSNSVAQVQQSTSEGFYSERSESIKITKDTGTTPADNKTRSLLDPVEALVDFFTGQVEVGFNVPLGLATVYIIDSMGGTVSSYSCNTNMESLVHLPIPTDKGGYTLKIVTSSAEYSGYFTF